MRDCQAGEELVKENVVSKEDNGLCEGSIILVEVGCKDVLIEHRVGEDVDQEDLSLGNGECYAACVIKSPSSAHSSVVQGHVEFQIH